MRIKRWYILGFISLLVISLLYVLLIVPKEQNLHSISKSYITNAYFPLKSIDLNTVHIKKEIIIKIPFENKGENLLRIHDIRTDCGCAIPKWPVKPLKSGARDTMIISFISYEEGFFRKTLSIFANQTGGPVIITISGIATK